MIALVLAATLFAAPASTVHKAPPDPIAVLPFRNLNADASLDWMKAGVAETMISDLKKSGKVRVVERAEIDKAMTEIALQASASDSEEMTAAKVGKLVGAKTIVVGSFQKAAKQLRINARFVSVETGEVLDTAKTTGAAGDPFALQDRVVAQLLGVKSGDAALPKRKPATAKTVEAYRLYAMALTVASDAERVGYLKQSLALDPDFVYSADELQRLKDRMTEYGKQNAAVVSDAASKLRATAFDDKASADDRARAAATLFSKLFAERRFHTLLHDAEALEKAGLPATTYVNAPELCSWGRFRALCGLRRMDLALQAGEQHLKRFPGGNYYSDVETTMKSEIMQREIWDKRRAEYEKDLAGIRDDLAKKPKPLSPADQSEWDFGPCIASIWTSQNNELMLDGCSAYVKKYEAVAKSDPDVRDHVRAARFSVVWALATLGRFDEARTESETLRADTHDEDQRLDNVFAMAPTDAEAAP